MSSNLIGKWHKALGRLAAAISDHIITTSCGKSTVKIQETKAQSQTHGTKCWNTCHVSMGGKRKIKASQTHGTRVLTCVTRQYGR